MNDFKTRFDNIAQHLDRAAEQCHREPPLLLAVSKKHSAAAIEAVYHLGQRHFGENYVQEALEKQQVLQHLEIVWHYIGPIQSNKTKDIANQFAWVHSIEREKIAQRLSNQRSAELPPLNVCIQINLDNESSKAGIAPGEAPALCEKIKGMPNLRLRGFMCIPKPQTDTTAQRQSFGRMKQLYEDIKQSGFPELDTLSMGMTNDYEAAIAEGATIVRIGTALFGKRI